MVIILHGKLDINSSCEKIPLKFIAFRSISRIYKKNFNSRDLKE